MVSERIQRQIDRLLDQAEQAVDAGDWPTVVDRARAVLAIDIDSADAQSFVKMAEANGVSAEAASSATALNDTRPPAAPSRSPSVEQPATQPTSFASGRYEVRRFLGEGGKKKVYLAHDLRLDRDVAFALIKTDGLDAAGRERIVREAQAMGRLGAHPHVVTIFEQGEEGGALYVVTELLEGGDVEGELEAAEGPLPLERTLAIAKDIARGLEFAHARSIVHRDVKPGNVWLTADGVAKVGDFGLAVSLDRSRLTQLGMMMVGTVAYMPPEQALGGDVTPQSDLYALGAMLYALGAMLYEMVTGRPPFQADDPTAIISQHINTPPVAPSWHSEHCPPDLEELILHLLQKAPDDRPESASAVAEVLGRVDPTLKSASHSDSGTNPLDRLARGVFVGRESELERLRGAFDDAYAGRGSVVMLVGQPGIGKTRTTQELATYARMRGGVVLWGGAQESGGAPPYWPWVLVARAYRDQTPDEERRRQYEPYAADLQRIFTGLPLLFPGLPEPPPLDSEEGQFRLFDAFSSLLRAIAVGKPLLVVLDDLHWADRATLQMLTHLAHELAHARVLVVGTYRDTDLDRQHPLSGTLAELNREQLFTRINLRGFTRDEVGDYIRAAALVEPPSALVERVHEETEGNPFFLAEVVNLMAQEGSLDKASVSDVAIPEGVKEALGRRLDRVSSEANELLSVAAVVGREFEHAELAAVSGKPDDELLRLVEESLAGRVLEETGHVCGYRFTHALMQETLLGELSAARRVRLHGEIARALESLYPSPDRPQLAAMAGHYRESALLNRDDAERAIVLTLRTAEHASEQLAWDEEARLLDRAIEIQRVLAPDDERLCDLLLAACEAAKRIDDWDRLLRVLAPEAFDLAERISSPERAARAAALGSWFGGWFVRGIPAWARDEAGPWIERLERYASVEPKFRALADLYGGVRKQVLGDAADVDSIIAGFDLARTLDDDETLGSALNLVLVLLQHPQFDGDRLSWARDAVEHSSRTGDFTNLTGQAISTFLSFGDRERAEELIDDLDRRTSERRVSPVQVNWLKATLATLDGRLDQVVDLGDELPLGPFRALARNRALLYLGRFDEAIEEAHEWWARVVPVVASGRGERARTEFATDERASPSAWLLTLKLEARTLLGDTDELPPLLDELSSGTAITTGMFYATMIDRHRAAALHLLGRHVEARERYDAALRDATRIRFRPEVALIRLGLAKLLLDHYPDERDAALEHLAFAIEEFGEMKMQPSLEEAPAKKEILKA